MVTIKKITGSIVRFLKVGNGYGLGIQSKTGEAFVITGAWEVDKKLLKLLDKSAFRAVKTKTEDVMYVPARGYEVTFEAAEDALAAARQEGSYFLNTEDFKIKTKVLDPFDWDGVVEKDFAAAKHDELPPPA